MPILKHETIEQIKSLDGRDLRHDIANPAILQVTEEFICVIENAISGAMRCRVHLSNKSAQTTLRQLKKAINNSEDQRLIEYVLAGYVFRSYLHRNEDMNSDLTAEQFVSGCSHGWLLQMLEDYTQPVSSAGANPDHERNAIIESLYQNMAAGFFDHTKSKPTSTPDNSVFMELMHAITQDPAIGLGLKSWQNHKDRTLDAIRALDKRNYFSIGDIPF